MVYLQSFVFEAPLCNFPRSPLKVIRTISLLTHRQGGETPTVHLKRHTCVQNAMFEKPAAAAVVHVENWSKP